MDNQIDTTAQAVTIRWTFEDVAHMAGLGYRVQAIPTATEEARTMYEAKITQDNGTCCSAKFDTYAAMVRWLARESADAGIEAWEDSEPIEQAQLQEDVGHYRP